MQIGIIGGGASGLTAAIAAAGCGAEVTILECRDRVGKKILATGNGRCNLSNLYFDPLRDYRSHRPDRLPGFFARFGVSQTIDFFESRGLLLTDRDGYLYPRSLQAAAVLDFLQGELSRLPVRVICGCRVLHIGTQGPFCVETDAGSYRFDRLIMACGSDAGLTGEHAQRGLALAGELGIRWYPPLPALTALRCEGGFWKGLAGVRCQARVTLSLAGQKRGRVYTEIGEVQLTEYGISGIPVFQLSRFAAETLNAGGSVTASLDFLPEYDGEVGRALFDRQFLACRGKTAGELGCGMLPKKVALFLLRLCHIQAEEIVTLRERERFQRFYEKARRFETKVMQTNPLSQSQVSMGGVSLDEVDDTLCAKRRRGLYFCGEMLDVDGRCGGYNLQWAWTSGYLAGLSAAKSDEKVEKP